VLSESKYIGLGCDPESYHDRLYKNTLKNKYYVSLFATLSLALFFSTKCKYPFQLTEISPSGA